MYNDILSAVLSLAVTFVGATLTTIIIPSIANWLKYKTQHQKLQSVIDDITVTVTSSVDMLEQTVVNQLKADGKWDSKSQAEVLQSAITEVINGLSRTTYQILKSESTDIEALIKRYIEAYIQSKKTDK
jgi:uncharacterized protein YjgD (DUF1641 family)|nr:MAG TPA: hypothetical protein [Caudoviricetes sp.]